MSYLGSRAVKPLRRDARGKAEYAVAKLELVGIQMISSGMYGEGPALGWHVTPWTEGIIRGFHFDQERTAPQDSDVIEAATGVLPDKYYVGRMSIGREYLESQSSLGCRRQHFKLPEIARGGTDGQKTCGCINDIGRTIRPLGPGDNPILMHHPRVNNCDALPLSNQSSSQSTEKHSPKSAVSMEVPAVHCLPVELLSKVFVDCACSTSILWCDVAITHHNLPMTLPALDKATELRILPEHKATASLMELCIARSGTYPMEVSLDLDIVPPEGVRECLKTWRTCISRCKLLRLKGTTQILQLLFQTTTELPFLEAIAMHYLTGLSLGVVDLNQSIIRLLREQRSSLKSLALHFIDYDESQMPVTSFPNLEEVELTFRCDWFITVLPAIIAPKLRNLSVTAPSPSPGAPLVVSLAAMLAVSGKRLQKLYIACFNVFESEQELYNILKAVPSLASLSIVGALVSGTRLDEILGALVRRDPATSQFPVPRLEKLDIRLVTRDIEDCVDEENLSHVLALRLRGECAIAKLETVDIHVAGSFDRPALEWRARPGMEDIVRVLESEYHVFSDGGSTTYLMVRVSHVQRVAVIGLSISPDAVLDGIGNLDTRTYQDRRRDGTYIGVL
ncbi:hypothetical protein GLOTRDRAFT_94679 [Gloeophyllum trabeum ATCC 11539]|uniref:Uncharacterized protein n=1 Tax=Gloeophyllum trabeum (strain ATCC 11539 / FP-39264 / Madison 617) TaxID=670483 RepID=S7Q0X7_GLOTA|nr:uncharacterized protein GLOTRDRAFT_94679 [Gloeophyllum trabeum ATCC 11539]EPQ53418.1 hypothetical protein GLOTRDRAFT_94679 [Gloeophyllum trabeum ATCC 11539]